MTISKFLVAVSAAALTTSAAATVEVRFTESAPKDSFTIVNNSTCDLKDFVLNLDLTATRGKLIFDTTGAGAGVEVFQPFESKKGGLQLTSASTVRDGDQSLTVQASVLAPGKKMSFTIDVDDTLRNSNLGQIRVTGGEMQDGTVSLTVKGTQPVTASFDGNNRAVMSSPCPTT